MILTLFKSRFNCTPTLRNINGISKPSIDATWPHASWSNWQARWCTCNTIKSGPHSLRIPFYRAASLHRSRCNPATKINKKAQPFNSLTLRLPQSAGAVSLRRIKKIKYSSYSCWLNLRIAFTHCLRSMRPRIFSSWVCIISNKFVLVMGSMSPSLPSCMAARKSYPSSAKKL